MNREQKSAAIATIATHIDESDAIFAVDYRGITVAQIAELRLKLREADATFKVVKNSLTERAADQAGAQALKDYLAGPTALTFVRGDAATAAKAVADYGRATQLLPFKGGLMDGEQLGVEEIRSLSRLPSREVLYGQLVGVVASPIGGLVRSLGGLLGGLAVALGQVRDKKSSGEIPAGEPQAAPGEAPAEQADEPVPGAEAQAPAEQADAEAPAGEAQAPAEQADAEAPAGEAQEGEAEAPEGEAAARAHDAGAEEAAAQEGEAEQAEPADASPADDGKQADVSAEAQPEDAETNPKED